uniref:TTF-type domain-containing protein n=1 Tax=Amphimedon queenslandica TaxID=400682 RepID=A0A1X7UU67_AMPQE
MVLVSEIVLDTASSSSETVRTGNALDIDINNCDKPVQPTITFPSTTLGKATRFQKKWYEQYPWQEYSIKLNAVFCFACRFFTNCSEPTFTSVGFKNWKHATGQKGIVMTHSISKYHTQAKAAWKNYNKRVAKGESVGCQLDRVGSKVIYDNRKYVKAVMECILHCHLQGIALRGHDQSDDSLNPCNFRLLMTLLSCHSPETSSSIKQELHDAKYITVLADESKDISKHERWSIAFRYVLDGKTMERFVGYTLATDLTAQSPTKYIMAKMNDLEVNHEHLVSQCYDGASVMYGSNAGVHKFIKKRSPQAVYIHCCAHRLNLVLVDVAKRNRAASDFFLHFQALYIFFSSAKSHELFLSNQNALAGREIHLKKLSDTRWSCRNV